MRLRPAIVRRPRAAGVAPLIGLLAMAGCMAPAGPRGAASMPQAADAPGLLVLELDLRRGAELLDSRGALRLLHHDLRVEYRVDGRGPGLDAGEVTLDGRPLRRAVGGRGSVAYRLERGAGGESVVADGQAWFTIVNRGGPDVPADSVRVKLAPFPVVTQPTPEQTLLRGEELAVVTLPPVAGVWQGVSLTGAGDAVRATELGPGRWLFPRGSLAGLATGRARLLIETEASCAVCPGGKVLRVSGTSRAELEIFVTLL